ncbi:MAG: replication initiator protein A [Candidatus Limivivens sp.]|nr:replication initiator protein A [Candidatus Limivivens sp.]
MTQFLTQDSLIPPYMAFPRFLLDKEGLSETAKILYTILLDRTRLSQKNDGWTDEQDHVFILFPIKNLAEVMHKSEMSIKTALTALEKESLIVRKRQGAGFPNRIYVRVPPETLAQTDRNLSVRQTENRPTDRQKTISITDRKLSSSNKEKNNIKRTNSESKDNRTAYGFYQNVFLTTEELSALQSEVPHYQEYIEKLSRYMASSGKQYASHAATIRSWALQDHPAPVKRTYECKEDESL